MEIELPYDPAISFLAFYPKKMNRFIQNGFMSKRKFQ